MDSIQNKESRSGLDNVELTFADIFRQLWRKKLWIIAVTSIAAVCSVYYAVGLPNLYKAETYLVPTENKKELNSQLGGIAALAGMDLAGQRNENSKLALEVMQSRTFLGNFIRKYDIAPDIMAADSWDIETRKLSYNSSEYDVDLKKWFRTPTSPLRTSEPSEQELVDAFKDLLEVEVEPSNNLIKISIEYISPDKASYWTNLLVSETNEFMRNRDISKAERSISYLQQQMENTSVSVIKTSLSSAIEEQIKVLTLANVEEEYVFTTLDKAVAPELKSKPKRALIVLMITFLAALISIFGVLFFGLKNKTS